jgi:hypothetical protein
MNTSVDKTKSEPDSGFTRGEAVLFRRADRLRYPALSSNGPVEHPTKSDPIDGSGLDAEPNDAARVLIHDD